MMDAHFIGAIQVLVYAGAIMVVFLFVVMLLNLGHPDEASDLRGNWGRLLAGLLGLAMLAQIIVLLRSPAPASLVQSDFQRAESLKDLNAVAAVAKPLFSDNLLAFELTSILLLVAIVGAVVLGKRRASA
jgi:NADH-quinone oxidoreductase subunit J